MRLVSWNICRRDEPWNALVENPTIDVALLQEAKGPPATFAHDVFPARVADWRMAGYVLAHALNASEPARRAGKRYPARARGGRDGERPRERLQSKTTR